MIQVHPKKAFLNTDIIISNTGDDPVLVRESGTSETFALSPGERRVSRFPAGMHQLEAMGFYKSCRVSFLVEDALKFGGSKRKKCHVFDGTPWVLVVMQDRTYFFNSRTNEQFVEHDLSPEGVYELNGGYLLFETDKEYSVFSLRSMSIEKTLTGMELIYKGNDHCVFAFEGGLHVYWVHPEKSGSRLLSYGCSAYLVDEENATVLFYDPKSPSSVKRITLFKENEDGLHMSVSIHPFEGDFVAFSGFNTVLYTPFNQKDGPLSLCCMRLNDYAIQLLYHDPTRPLSVVNGQTLWTDQDYAGIQNGSIKEGEAHEVSVRVIEQAGRVYQIRKTRTIRVVEKQKVRTTIQSHLIEGPSKEILHVFSDLEFSQNGRWRYLSRHDLAHDYLLTDNGLLVLTGTLAFTESGDPYVIETDNNKNKQYKTIDGEDLPIDNKCSNPSLGFFHAPAPEGDSYIWLFDGREYVGNDVKKTKGAIVVGGWTKGNIPPRFFLKDGTVIPVPGSLDNVVSISESGRTLLSEKGGFFSISRYSDSGWTHLENLVLSIYDTLHVSDAVFCEDGQSFIYQKNKDLVFYDFATGSETVFPSNSGIEQNINGYRPYCVKDYFSRPVIVDPLSRKTIDHSFLGQYRFVSPDGTAHFEKCITKYFLKDGGREISEKEYQDLKEQYDSSGLLGIPNAENKAHREEFFKCTGKEMSAWRLELTIADFVGWYIVDKIEYAVINRNGAIEEVRIGAPLYYLNYVSFSSDGSQVAISGKYKDGSGLCVIYDLDKKEEVYRSTSQLKGGPGKTKAVWLGLFGKDGSVAFYDSTPNTYLVRKDFSTESISGRSLLTFSPSGKYIAFSRQGYQPYSGEGITWGHVPSCDIYIARTAEPKKMLCHYCDHGSEIMGVAQLHDTVASASFSADEKKILSVSKDGVVVVRNLHLE